MGEACTTPSSQLHHRCYAQEFQRVLKSNVQRRGDEVTFRYPTGLYRQLCLLSDSLALERAAYWTSEQHIKMSTETFCGGPNSKSPWTIARGR